MVAGSAGGILDEVGEALAVEVHADDVELAMVVAGDKHAHGAAFGADIDKAEVVCAVAAEDHAMPGPGEASGKQGREIVGAGKAGDVGEVGDAHVADTAAGADGGAEAGEPLERDALGLRVVLQLDGGDGCVETVSRGEPEMQRQHGREREDKCTGGVFHWLPPELWVLLWFWPEPARVWS